MLERGINQVNSMQFYFINNYEDRLEPWMLPNIMDSRLEKIAHRINKSFTAVRLLFLFPFFS